MCDDAASTLYQHKNGVGVCVGSVWVVKMFVRVCETCLQIVRVLHLSYKQTRQSSLGHSDTNIGSSISEIS